MFVFPLAVLQAGCGLFTEPAPPDVPNVLLLTVDTLRADHLSRTGFELPTTPALDALLAKGVVFEQAATPIPRTTPALASLLTGRYPQRSHIRRLGHRLREGIPTVATYAQAHGYDTIAVVSNHVLPPRRGLNRDFRIYDFAADVRDARTTVDRALNHVERAPRHKPLFVWVHLIDPHVPYRSDERWAREFDPDYVGPYQGGFGEHKKSGPYPVELPKHEAVFENPLPDEVNAHIRKLYAADVRYTDESIRELIDGLIEERGPGWKVAFTSDHGESLGEHDFFYDHGDYVYQATLHVPLAFVDLEAPALEPRVVNGWVSLVDVLPTLAADLGWAPPVDVDGISHADHFEGGRVEDQPVFGECGKTFFPEHVRRRVRFDVSGRFRSVILGSLKLIYTPGLADDDAWELYDLAADPTETTNLWAERLDDPEVAKLRAALTRHLAADPKTGSKLAESAEDLELLRNLGYVE